MTGPSGSAPAAGTVAALVALPLGTRVVVRYRVGELATDVLGLLVSLGKHSCDIRTRRGDVTVEYTAIVAAKQIPPPPGPRTPSGPGVRG